MTEIRRSLTQAQGFGFEAYEISAQEAQGHFPWMSLDGIVGAAWIPSDGYIDPYGLTMAYAKGARAGGVRLREGILVTGFEISDGKVRKVLTDHGAVDCEIVVNAAGIWAKRIGEMAGVALAAGAVQHQYIVTEKKIDVTHKTPTFRDPDRIFYLKPDVGSFAIGGWEKGAPACWPEGVPFDWEKMPATRNSSASAGSPIAFSRCRAGAATSAYACRVQVPRSISVAPSSERTPKRRPKPASRPKSSTSATTA